jgi:hypothetical protein
VRFFSSTTTITPFWQCGTCRRNRPSLDWFMLLFSFSQVAASIFKKLRWDWVDAYRKCVVVVYITPFITSILANPASPLSVLVSLVSSGVWGSYRPILEGRYIHLLAGFFFFSSHIR